VLVELPLFARYLRLTDDELRAVQRDIMDNPHCGDLIPGGRGLRKMRAAIGGRGKRGGGRIITCGRPATPATGCLPIRGPSRVT
jgi:hypothetical protein